MRKALFVFSFLALTPGVAVADETEDEAPQSVTHEYSPYEKETIANALAADKLEIEPNPEGKTIEGFDVVTLEVFEKRDPIPSWFNVFHWTTKPYVIERELLQSPGEPYRQVLIDETARNLRGKAAQLSVVLVVAVKGHKPGTVRILVITKDVWSLRLNSSYVLTQNGLEYLFLQPSEQNVFGTHHSAALNFEWRPLSYETGFTYRIPWVAGTRWRAALTAAIDINHATGQAEGTTGSVSLSYPLWSTRTPLGADLYYTWQHNVFRQYRDGKQAGFVARGLPQGTTPIPWRYHTDYDYGGADVIRAWGWARKIALTVGAEALHQKYTPDDLSGYDPANRDAFLNKQVPRDDTRVGPFAQVRFYKTDYLRVLDVDVLSLQEDFRLGHDIVAKVYPVFTALGSTRNFLGLTLNAQYTFAMGDGFIRPAAFTTLETTGDHADTMFTRAMVHTVSPRTPAGRLVFDVDAIHRFRNYYNNLTTLGGSRRLRGYPTSYTFGPNAIAQTVEWRSPPVDILHTSWGLVGFWDVGTAYENVSDMQLHHSVGAGIRALFPQFDRVVIRGDLGFPVYRGERPSGVSPVAFLISVEQAFPVPNLIDQSHTID